jgi:hypothetical protein
LGFFLLSWYVERINILGDLRRFVVCGWRLGSRVRVFLKWSKATATAYSHHLYPAGCWDFGTTHPKTVYICQYYGFTTMKMLFYCLIILNNIILMIDNDQSTTIKAPEVYKSIPTHSPSRNQRQNQGKSPISILTPTMDMLWSILLNQTFRISYSH